MAREYKMDDATLNGRFDTLEDKLDGLSATLANVLAEVGNVPPIAERRGRKTVTDRLHGLEAQTSPAVFEATIDRVMHRRRATFWTTTQKFSLFGFAAVAALGTILHALGIGG